ncbi:hypothetical protein DFJ73DRAFT_814835 [Zopfochytrium polystomum]|nr:hypothetical protein DFJ73DRAFT_814835 [Zopfochytrium polystomum]
MKLILLSVLSVVALFAVCHEIFLRSPLRLLVAVSISLRQRRHLRGRIGCIGHKSGVLGHARSAPPSHFFLPCSLSSPIHRRRRVRSDAIVVLFNFCDKLPRRKAHWFSWGDAEKIIRRFPTSPPFTDAHRTLHFKHSGCWYNGNLLARRPDVSHARLADRVVCKAVRKRRPDGFNVQRLDRAVRHGHDANRHTVKNANAGRRGRVRLKNRGSDSTVEPKPPLVVRLDGLMGVGVASKFSTATGATAGSALMLSRSAATVGD